MTTLLVTNDFPPRPGGIESYVRSWCDLVPPDDLVVYASPSPGAEAYDAEQPFRVVRDPMSVLLPTLRVARRAAELVRGTGSTRVVFGASVPLGLMAPALRRAGAEHLTAMTHGHEIWWARLPGTRQLLRRVAANVDEVTYVSEWCRDRIAPALRPSDRAKLRRQVPVVDRSVFRPGCGGAEVRAALGIPQDALVVICVGRLVRRKGQDTLVRIWPDVLERWPGAVLLLVGEGPDRGRLERLVARHGIGSAVRLVGRVDAVPPYLDAADVFAMPCRSRRFGLEAEGFGIVYLEAAAMGLTIVGGSSGGAPEAVALARAGAFGPKMPARVATITE